MKSVTTSYHAEENGRNPFDNLKLQEIINKGKGWLIKDNVENNYIRYYQGFCIVFDELESHFEVITVYTKSNPEEFYEDRRYNVKLSK